VDAPGTLYVVPTPLGDLADLSPRCREVLGSVPCIAAEDTRVTLRLLRALALPIPHLVSVHDHNEEQRAPQLVRRLLQGQSVALVSDAGTPLVSDPGYRVVRAAVEAGVPVVPLPGPCAAITALSAAGLPSDRFVFLGFPPRDAARRRRLFSRYRREQATLVLYTSPHRVADVLEDALAGWGDRSAAVASQLTKPSAAWARGSLSALHREAGSLGGELTLVVAGAVDLLPEEDERVEQLIDALVASGVSVGVVRDVVASVYARSRRWVYQRALSAPGAEPR